MTAIPSWFRDARYGLFIHYGLFSLLERGEWAMNKEQIPLSEYRKLMTRFTAEKFDADALIRRARDWGMRYATMVTKHQEGFCLYNSSVTDFNSVKSAAKRDLVAEFVAACRKYGLKISLYHSLDDWQLVPNAVDALERPLECHEKFITQVHAEIRDIMSNYGPIDVMWYDGWWPFDGDGWRSRELHEMVRKLQPHILMNGRAAIPGDFATPENQVLPADRMWEACMCHNNNWGYHAGDHNWKQPREIAQMLARTAAYQGNLLLNVGPRGDGSVPEEAGRILDRVGEWMKVNGEAIYGSDRFVMDLRKRGDARADWSQHGSYTAKGNAFFLHASSWPGSRLVITGVECQVEDVAILGKQGTLPFAQDGKRLTVTGLPETVDPTLPTVIRFRTKDAPCIYRTGGHYDPRVPHCRYDPVESEVLF
jgi:alpha-L-fucosidase